MAYVSYLSSEVVEDWSDGLINRREALRRLTLLGISASTAAAALMAAGQPTTARSVAPDASGPGDAVTAAPSGAPGIAGTSITFAGSRVELRGHLAEAVGPRGGVLVVHENRGLTDHIRTVAERFAGAGYTALAIDLLSEEGGTDAIADEGSVSGILGAAPGERLVEDMRAGLDELERRVPGAKLGAIGFCFGGGMVWALLDAGDPRLAVGIPFYGPAPEAPRFDAVDAAVLGIYAEMDDRVNASQARVRAALESAGLTFKLNVYPGVGHAFFNDTGGRYDAVQAAQAWSDATAWLDQFLAGSDQVV